MIVESTFVTQLSIDGDKNTVRLSIVYGRNKSVGDSWRVDETYIKVKGTWHYLYRAIDSLGLILDIWLRKNRDSQAAYSFFK